MAPSRTSLTGREVVVGVVVGTVVVVEVEVVVVDDAVVGAAVEVVEPATKLMFCPLLLECLFGSFLPVFHDPIP